MRRLCLTGFLAFALTSCGESITGSFVEDLDALQISVRAQPSTIPAGSSANVLMTLTNTSAKYVAISPCPMYFWVEESSGQIVGGSKSIGCLAGTLVVQPPLRFRPAESKTITFRWEATDTQNVPPGTYDVFGWVGWEQRVSAPAQVTVLPAN